MSKEKKDFEGLGELLDHDYDGIQELDNPLPGWWLLTFYGAIVFSVIYFSYYTFFGGPTLDEELKADLAKIEMKIQESRKNEGQTDLASLMNQKEVIAKGKAAFDLRCAACHGAQGQGLIGPNLTDDHWIHGDSSLVEIKAVIQKGVLEKGMPAWEAVMSGEEIDAATVYIKSLHGSNPPNPKEPQGEKKENKI